MGLDQYAYIRNKNDTGRNMFVIETYLEPEYDDDPTLKKFLEKIYSNKSFKWYIEKDSKLPDINEYVLFEFHKNDKSVLCKVKKISHDESINTVLLKPICTRRREEDFYWRKNYSLHEYIEQIYRKRCDNPIEFNGVEMELKNSDIKNLEKHILDPDSRWDRRDRKDDLLFCKRVLLRIKKGEKIMYDSSG